MDTMILHVRKTSMELNIRKCSAQTPQSTCRAFAGLPKTTQFAGISCARTVSMFPLFRWFAQGPMLSQVQVKAKMVYTCLDNNGPSAHDRVITDADTCFDDASITDVDVFAYVDFASSLCTLASLHWPRKSGLLQSRDGHTSTDLRIPSYHDPARVKQLTARPKNSIVPNREVVAIVAVERRGHIDAMTEKTGDLPLTSTRVNPPSRNELPEEPRALVRSFLHSCVEAERCLRGETTLVNESFGVWQERLP
jgi:hypothetical protein